MEPEPNPPLSEEDALTEAALSDPAGTEPAELDRPPTFWRVVVLAVVALVALWVVFGIAR
jgi:anti-sigma-K factor RskA